MAGSTTVIARTGPISETWRRFPRLKPRDKVGQLCHQLWEPWVMLGMAAGVVGHARLGQEATRRDKAVDPPLWLLVPTGGTSRVSPSRAREETAESRGMPCPFLNTERGFGGKTPKKSELLDLPRFRG